MDISYLLLLQYLRELTGGIANSFFMFITDLGSSVLPFLVLAGMYWCIDKQIGEYMMLNTFFGDWINGVVKITACVYRPWIRSDMIHSVDEARLTATGYSFPSGHTTQAVAVWGGMAVSYRKEKLLRNGLIGLIILIAFSRNYLGVHTPQDVLVAATIGFVLLYVTYHLQKWVSAKEERNKWILIATVIMAIFMILYASLKNYPMDYVDGQLLVDPQKMALNSWSAGGQLLGFGLGWYCEHKWVKFTVEGTISDKLGRFLLGGIGILLFYYLAAPMLELIFPTNIAYFGQHFVFALFIVYVYPLIFSRKKK